MSRDSTIDHLVEKTVVPSFTSIGPRLRRRLFDWRTLESYDLSGQVIVLTGGTSGIGEAAVSILAGLGATLEVVGRDADKTHGLVERLKGESGNPAIDAVIGDLGELDDVRSVAATLAGRHARIDVLAHNAGALFPKRRRTGDGTDLAVELMVAAPFLLTGLLLPRLRGGAAADGDGGGTSAGRTSAGRASAGRASAGRVLTMSSGGMYTEPLTVDRLEMSDAEYSGTAQYARAKRAQVALNEAWAAHVPPDEIVFHALHPGWVDTPGINEALPGFSRVLSPLGLLRTAREGADTLVWLAADERALESSGDFWLDREARSTHKMDKTRVADTPERRAALWRWCEMRTGWSMDGEGDQLST